jgi:hypothetical protein
MINKSISNSSPFEFCILIFCQTSQKQLSNSFAFGLCILDKLAFSCDGLPNLPVLRGLCNRGTGIPRAIRTAHRLPSATRVRARRRLCAVSLRLGIERSRNLGSKSRPGPDRVRARSPRLDPERRVARSGTPGSSGATKILQKTGQVIQIATQLDFLY